MEDAQYQKYEQLCRKLRIKRTDHILEIGTGWGGFAIYAVKNFDCRVTTVTISQSQYDYAVAKIAQEGLSSKIKVELKDYRLDNFDIGYATLSSVISALNISQPDVSVYADLIRRFLLSSFHTCSRP